MEPPWRRRARPALTSGGDGGLRRPQGSSAQLGPAGGELLRREKGKGGKSYFASQCYSPTTHKAPLPQTTLRGYRVQGQVLPQLHSLWLGLRGEGGKAAPTPLPESFQSFGSQFLTLWLRAAPAQLSLRCPALGSVAKPWPWPRTSCSWESCRSDCSLCPGMAQQGKNSKAGKSGAFPEGATPCLSVPAPGAGSEPAHRQLLTRDSPFCGRHQPPRPSHGGSSRHCGSGGTRAPCRQPDLSSVRSQPRDGSE